MDSLALLCNLHADGPLTLQRLRRIGCESLSSLADVDPEALARELDGDAPAAERFLREAGLLEERLRLGAQPAQAPARAKASAPTAEREPSAPSRNPPPATPAMPARASAEDRTAASDRPRGVGDVLEAWRALDQSEPPEAPREYVVPRPPELAGNRGLDQTAIEGLTSQWVGRLAEQGILSLRGLIEAEPLELSRSIGLPFTRLRRLQFLAGRAWEEASEEDDAVAVPGGPRPDEPREERAPHELGGSGGPFA